MFSRASGTYFSCEQQDTESEDGRHFDDREQQFVGLHDALCLLWDIPPSAVSIFPFKDGYQSGGNQEDHSPEK